MYDIYQYLPDVTDFNLTLRSREASQRHYLLRFQSARAARPKHRYATAYYNNFFHFLPLTIFILLY